MSSALSRFLATDRWMALWNAFCGESTENKTPAASLPLVLIALVVAVLAPGFAILDTTVRSQVSLSTLAFGIGAVLALLIRRKMGISPTGEWRKALSLTHTAFAVGTIPAILVLAVHPEFLSDRHDTLGEMMAPGGEKRVSVWQLIAMAPLAALWVGITEELIFRGLLVSVLRRWRIFSTQQKCDLFAIVISSIIFGAAHTITWGPFAGIALTGLGIGFAIGYIANGERIWPVALYHFAFDTLSMLVALFI